MPLLNSTTTVAVDTTLGEIQAVLRKSGARSILVDDDERGVPTSVAFKVVTPLGEESYRQLYADRRLALPPASTERG